MGMSVRMQCSTWGSAQFKIGADRRRSAPIGADRRRSAPIGADRRLSRSQVMLPILLHPTLLHSLPPSVRCGLHRCRSAPIGADRRRSAPIGADRRRSAPIGADRRRSAPTSAPVRPRPSVRVCSSDRPSASDVPSVGVSVSHHAYSVSHPRTRFRSSRFGFGQADSVSV